jgi:SAM-dependent methyltransferase
MFMNILRTGKIEAFNLDSWRNMLKKKIGASFLFLIAFITLCSFNKFPESACAHYYLDGLRGIEIGGAAHNPFGLKTLNVDYTKDTSTMFKRLELSLCGECLKVDLAAPGDKLPFKDNSFDFVVNSHVLQYFYDPVRAIQEWLRVIKPGGYVFMIIPHKDRTSEWNKPRTSLSEIIDRHDHPNPIVNDHSTRHSIWITEDLIDICHHYRWKVIDCHDTDDKVGNGFIIILQKKLNDPQPTMLNFSDEDFGS